MRRGGPGPPTGRRPPEDAVPYPFIGSHRLAQALRLVAQSLGRAQNHCGDLYRRRKARLGAPKAITAMAHKLARILWHLLKHQEPFNPEVFAQEEAQMKCRQIARLQNLARFLNCSLVPNP